MSKTRVSLGGIARICAVLVCLLVAARAQGDGSCPAMSGAAPALAGRDADRRLEYIRARLADEASRAHIWNDSWAIGYGLLTATQLVLVPVFDDDGVRADLYVGAGSSAVGLLALVVMPLEVIGDHVELEQLLWDGDERPGRCKILARAESLFRSAAENEAFGRSVWMHAASALVNIGAGLVLGLGFDRWESGVINAAAGIALGELMILTQPDHLAEQLGRYRSGDFELDADERTLSWALLPGSAGSKFGLSLMLWF